MNIKKISRIGVVFAFAISRGSLFAAEYYVSATGEMQGFYKVDVRINE